MKRRPSWKAMALASCVAVLIPISVSQSAAATPATAAPAAGTDCVTQIPIVSTMAVTPSGAVVAPKDGDGNARRYYYSSGDPTDNAWEVVPPAGFSPLDASDKTLAAYGFQPRPTDSTALAQWTRDMSGWKSGGRPSLCETDLRSAMATTKHEPSTAGPSGAAMPHGITNTRQSIIYAGNMAVNGTLSTNTFWTTDVTWTQPAFSSNTCGPGAAYSAWGGLGGWNSVTSTSIGRLLQSGVNTYDTLNQWMFFEAIAPGHGNGAIAWTDTQGTVFGGDNIESWVYDTGGTASMNVINHTRGYSHNFTFTSWQGLSAPGWWDGTTAEAFTEDPSTAQVLGVPLLRPNAGGTNILSQTVDGQPISSFSSWKFNNWTDDVPTHKLQTTNDDGVHGFINAWGACT